MSRDVDDLGTQLRDTLAREIHDRSIPGANAAALLGGRLAWSGAAGLRDIEGPALLPMDALFPIYSITKTFTAVAALRLAMAGRLRLDDAISRWLPNLPFAERVTLRQLLAHTGGVVNYSSLPEYHGDVAAHPGTPWSFDEFVDRAATRPLDFEPGTAWNYSNTGYTLAKRILELETEDSFAEVVERNIVEPLGLESTRVIEGPEQMRSLVPGYSKLFDPDRPARDVRDTYHPGWCGTGVMASTAPEVCRFFEAIFEESLLSATARDEMLTLTRVPGNHPPIVEASYGLGIMADSSGRFGAEYGHGGGGPGWNLRASYWPSSNGRRVALAVFCNTDTDDAWPIGHALADVISRNPT